MVKPASHYIAKGRQAVNAYLIVEDAAACIDFLQAVFNAELLNKMADDNGTVLHAEVGIGGSCVELGNANPDFPPLASAQHIYVPDADATFQKAIELGATEVYPLADMFYGERSGGVKDPFGNIWFIATATEELTDEEIFERGKQQGHG